VTILLTLFSTELLLQGGAQSTRQRQLCLHQPGQETIADHHEGGQQVLERNIQYNTVCI
jgi:hypothetical protein